jgi:hypothetical protein
VLCEFTRMEAQIICLRVFGTGVQLAGIVGV